MANRNLTFMHIHLVIEYFRLIN